MINKEEEREGGKEKRYSSFEIYSKESTIIYCTIAVTCTMLCIQ